jgi:hypothetical protein
MEFLKGWPSLLVTFALGNNTPLVFETPSGTLFAVDTLHEIHVTFFWPDLL